MVHERSFFAEHVRMNSRMSSHTCWNAPKKTKPKAIKLSRRIIENRYFIALTAFLTVYALVGDDVRLIFTNKPADNWFNGITITCLLVFTLEIVLSCIGKEDYPFGFFMALDVISTASLILDLTWISELVLGDGEDLDKMRSGRTARIGAKAGRVVRVIRLVRILKLYKAIYDARSKVKKKRVADPGDEDDWDDIEVDADNSNNLAESRVGKKLSEMTTRRVIILVLAMLLVLPLLRTETADQNPPAGYYAADTIREAFTDYVGVPNWKTQVDQDSLPSKLRSFLEEERRARYENEILKYMYYHNWFQGNDGGCPPHSDMPYSCSSWYFNHVFWMGIVSETSGQDLVDRASHAQLRAESVQSYNHKAAEQNALYNFGTMPSEALNRLSAPWTDECDEISKGRYRRGVSLIDQEIPSKVSYPVACPSDLRYLEVIKFFPRLISESEFKRCHFAFYFDMRPFTKQESIFGLVITAFVCVVLLIASLYFANDANTLVLRPVENMIKRVEAIRENPLIAMKMADEEFKAEEKERSRRSKLKKKPLKVRCKENFRCGTKPNLGPPLETVVLEKTIIKLGSLLALGFGQAGANIIHTNMECGDSAGVNPMIPGLKVECIVGKARIRDFSTATEVLQAKIMTFVNQIAEIVHGVVDEYHGAANKNNGNTFLLIWQLAGTRESSARIADLSMIAFARILGAVHRSPVLAEYREHPGLQLRLGQMCRVCLSFGLHAGWAIEGAVGTEFKIDASYLSPNVSLASSVEVATNVYSVPILISQSVTELCSAEMAAKLRLIDQVSMKGSKVPMELFSLDLDFMAMPVDDPKDMNMVWTSRQRFKVRQILEAEKKRKLDDEVSTWVLFDQNKDINLMRRRFTVEFMQMFNMGYQNYSQGEWEVARRLLSDTRTMLRVEDGPSVALLRFMETPHRFTAPDKWDGIRPLVFAGNE